jgi:hypothetical protein
MSGPTAPPGTVRLFPLAQYQRERLILAFNNEPVLSPFERLDDLLNFVVESHRPATIQAVEFCARNGGDLEISDVPAFRIKPHLFAQVACCDAGAEFLLTRRQRALHSESNEGLVVEEIQGRLKNFNFQALDLEPLCEVPPTDKRRDGNIRLGFGNIGRDAPTREHGQQQDYTGQRFHALDPPNLIAVRREQHCVPRVKRRRRFVWRCRAGHVPRRFPS